MFSMRKTTISRLFLKFLSDAQHRPVELIRCKAYHYAALNELILRIRKSLRLFPRLRFFIIVTGVSETQSKIGAKLLS